MEINKPAFPVTKINVAALIIILFYILGLIFPNLFWTTHSLSFFPIVVSIGIIFVSILVLFKYPIKLIQLDLSSNITIGLITLVSALIMYNFPILHDHYGDSYKFIPFLNKIALVIPEMAKEKLFSFRIGPSDGQDSILSIVTYMSYYFNITYSIAFLWLGVCCGSLYVLSWQIFIRFLFKKKTTQLVMLLVGCTAPFLLNYFGHLEIYAPILLFNFIWMMLLVAYYQVRSSKIIWLLIPLWIICLKLHAVAVLSFPVLVLTVLFHFKENNLTLRKLLTFRGLIIWVITPIVFIGMIVYFFVLEDHVDSRSLSEIVFGMDRLFLPLFSPAPPLDNYNLLSVNHIFDFLVLPFLWSPISIFLIIVVLGKRKSLNWNHIPLLLVGLILLLNCMLFFAANPMLSMPVDWDLFCLPAVPFLIFVSLLMQQLERIEFSISQLLPGTFAIIIISLPFFILHSSTSMSSKRYEALGFRIYDSYYEWTYKRMDYALKLNSKNLEDLFVKREKIIAQLRPKALKESDPEFAQFLTDQGRYLLRESKELEQSLSYFIESDMYDSYPGNTILHMEALFGLGRYDEALDKALILTEAEYPTKQKSISIVIHCALKAKEFEIAKKHTTLYIEQWESDLISEVHYHLINNLDLDRLDLLFE
ncbi:MAG: hypothetical protein ACI8Q1_000214 [Parvicella sp.]|jgi:hypothetical protein